jgi:hypothetical protein
LLPHLGTNPTWFRMCNPGPSWKSNKSPFLSDAGWSAISETRALRLSPHLFAREKFGLETELQLDLVWLLADWFEELTRHWTKPRQFRSYWADRRRREVWNIDQHYMVFETESLN